ncbi:hypothetical protein EGT49_00850 [Companilactobacillus suantsaicola]|uniref:Uncharacterized protein n=1 Tax=Companilactobacillus suantsaicola TaxID=2487723 RepID=A0A4Z0JQ19_9LACO|nr:hypothetical protein EGT49_00850 [Companilactobacillus suantsaicola]
MRIDSQLITPFFYCLLSALPIRDSYAVVEDNHEPFGFADIETVMESLKGDRNPYSALPIRDSYEVAKDNQEPSTSLIKQILPNVAIYDKIVSII